MSKQPIIKIARTYAEPVKTLSAKEIAALPYSEMHKQIAAQEGLAGKQATIGPIAWRLLLDLRAGKEFTEIKQKKSSLFFVGHQQVKAFAVRQLEKRGYIQPFNAGGGASMNAQDEQLLGGILLYAMLFSIFVMLAFEFACRVFKLIKKHKSEFFA